MHRFVATLALLLIVTVPAFGQAGKSWINGISYGGESISCDLPNSEQMKNVGSKLDGTGMCVFTSIEHSARYQGLEQMRGWRDWCAKNYKGGGYPQKVDQLLALWFKAKSIQPIPYLQYQGNDPSEIMSLIDKTNRMASSTYGYSPRYGKQFIAHMVNPILYGTNYATVLDNNFPGDTKYEWMEKAELVRRMRLSPNGATGSAWVFVWLTPGSPPPPKGRS